MRPDVQAELQQAVGSQVLTRDGEEIGRLKEVTGEFFKVDARLHRDYWLPTEAVVRSDGAVRIAIASDHVDDLKLAAPEPSMDALQLLMLMHEEQKALFHQLMVADGDEARGLWEMLVRAAKVHEELEDTYVYGPLQEQLRDDSTLASWEDEHHRDVTELEGMIARANEFMPGSGEFRSVARQMRATLERHIEREEREIFPKIREVWTADILHDVGRELFAAKTERLGASP